MHTRFSNKIPKYSQVSVPPLDGQKSPAEQRFVGGVFALSACYIGNAAGLLCCLRDSALFALWFIRLVFNNRWLWSIGIRCFLWLRIRPPALSPTLSLALSPTLPRARCPASASGRHGLVRLVRICRCKPLRLHTRARSVYTAGARLFLPVIHAPALGSHISAASTLHCHASALETSSASAQHRGASTASAGHRPTLHHHVPASKTLAKSTHASALEALAKSTHAWALEALAESTRARALPALDVLIRTLGERAKWARYPGIIRLCRLEVYVHLRSAGHSASQSLPAAATATPAASARTGKRLTGHDRHCQNNNDRCFDSCLFHFRFLSFTFHFSAFLSPVLGSFYRDSGAGVKKVTPGENFSGKLFVLSIENGRLRKYQPVSAAIYFISMFRLSCKSGIKTKKNLQTG
jgi:hypothetical protein